MLRSLLGCSEIIYPTISRIASLHPFHSLGQGFETSPHAAEGFFGLRHLIVYNKLFMSLFWN